MYSNLTLYYLNQMGICPWINKENSLESIEKSSTVCPLKLVVLVSNELKGKAESLFKHMMTYLNIINDELLIIKIKEEDSNQWISSVEKIRPQAILALGPDLKNKFVNLNLPYPALQSLAPEYLLNHPSYKKNAFQDLAQLKKLIS